MSFPDNTFHQRCILYLNKDTYNVPNKSPITTFINLASKVELQKELEILIFKTSNIPPKILEIVYCSSTDSSTITINTNLDLIHCLSSQRPTEDVTLCVKWTEFGDEHKAMSDEQQVQHGVSDFSILPQMSQQIHPPSQITGLYNIVRNINDSNEFGFSFPNTFLEQVEKANMPPNVTFPVSNDTLAYPNLHIPQFDVIPPRQSNSNPIPYVTMNSSTTYMVPITLTVPVSDSNQHNMIETIPEAGPIENNSQAGRLVEGNNTLAPVPLTGGEGRSVSEELLSKPTPLAGADGRSINEEQPSSGVTTSSSSVLQTNIPTTDNTDNSIQKCDKPNTRSRCRKKDLEMENKMNVRLRQSQNSNKANESGHKAVPIMKTKKLEKENKENSFVGGLFYAPTPELLKTIYGAKVKAENKDLKVSIEHWNLRLCPSIDNQVILEGNQENLVGFKNNLSQGIKQKDKSRKLNKKTTKKASVLQVSFAESLVVKPENSDDDDEIHNKQKCQNSSLKTRAKTSARMNKDEFKTEPEDSSLNEVSPNEKSENRDSEHVSFGDDFVSDSSAFCGTKEDHRNIKKRLDNNLPRLEVATLDEIEESVKTRENHTKKKSGRKKKVVTGKKGRQKSQKTDCEVDNYRNWEDVGPFGAADDNNDEDPNSRQMCEREIEVQDMLYDVNQYRDGNNGKEIDESCCEKEIMKKSPSSKNTIDSDTDEYNSEDTDFDSDNIIQDDEYNNDNHKAKIKKKQGKKRKSKTEKTGPSKKRRSYECAICDYTTFRKDDWTRHLKVEHNICQPKKPFSRPVTKLCPQCGFQSHLHQDIEDHMYMKHNTEIEHPEPRYVCDKCAKRYEFKKALVLHISHYHKERTFHCSQCDMRFDSFTKMSTHKRQTHRDLNRKHECSYCSKKFTWQNKLRYHINAVHLKQKYEVCPWEGCGKTFNQKWSLKVHLRTHTDEKPMKCLHCTYSCRQKTSLDWHVKSKHAAFVQPEHSVYPQ